MANPKLAKLVNSQVRVIVVDGRQLVGTLLSFDGHMNLIVDGTQEFRKTKAGETLQRPVGLVLLRGDTVVSTTVETGSRGQQEARLGPISMQL